MDNLISDEIWWSRQAPQAKNEGRQLAVTPKETQNYECDFDEFVDLNPFTFDSNSISDPALDAYPNNLITLSNPFPDTLQLAPSPPSNDTEFSSESSSSLFSDLSFQTNTQLSEEDSPWNSLQATALNGSRFDERGLPQHLLQGEVSTVFKYQNMPYW